MPPPFIPSIADRQLPGHEPCRAGGHPLGAETKKGGTLPLENPLRFEGNIVESLSVCQFLILPLCLQGREILDFCPGRV
jgi:hypothetical protein